MITKQMLASCLAVLGENYEKTTSDSMLELWYEVFNDLDARLFKKTCETFLKTSSCFPKINEFTSMYRQIEKELEQENYEKLKASQRLLVQGQRDCYLCNNTGFCSYDRDGYEIWARCICGHGKDLNKFSKAQIDNSYVPQSSSNYTQSEIARLKEGKNPFYLPTIKEVLGSNYAIYKAQKKAQKIDKPNLSDSDKLKILRGFEND